VGSTESVEVRVDGRRTSLAAGATVLDACDAAGRYVPRLCHYPGLTEADDEATLSECGLCAVRLADGSEVLACKTIIVSGMEICTDDARLRALRSERMSKILARHPHVCLLCPDRDGCSRDVCAHGHPPEARCCELRGRCELGRIVDFVDAALPVVVRAVTVSRTAVNEGRIRREMGLCIGCGRCVRACAGAAEAGRALEMAADNTARPKKGSLRESGCTFCGLCVLVCPAGALTAPGVAGARWLAARREELQVGVPALPPVASMAFDPATVATIPHASGVFMRFDPSGEVIRISGVEDLREHLVAALSDPACTGATGLRVELDPLYTQRESELLALYVQEHGHLPPGNGSDDDLFDDDPF